MFVAEFRFCASEVNTETKKEIISNTQLRNLKYRTVGRTILQ
jgi:hypothetical protein